MEYILSQHDLETNETDALEDPELIMDVMEARENLELAASREEVGALQAENQGISHYFYFGLILIIFICHRKNRPASTRDRISCGGTGLEKSQDSCNQAEVPPGN